jgi:glutathione S-transferase
MTGLTNLTLHSYRRCPFAIRVRMVLEEKGLEYLRVEEDLSNLSAQLLALHPEGRVPLLIHQDGNDRHVLYESSIITNYLDDAFPDHPLMPKLPIDRAQVGLLTYWCDRVFKPKLDLFKYEQSKLTQPELTTLQQELHEQLSFLNAALRLTSTGSSETKSFLIGDHLTLADIHLFPLVRQFMAIKPALPEVEKYVHVIDWLQRMMARPAFVRCMLK